jgi:hypothetical protein
MDPILGHVDSPEVRDILLPPFIAGARPDGEWVDPNGVKLWEIRRKCMKLIRAERE